jgi:hypothetical protein
VVCYDSTGASDVSFCHKADTLLRSDPHPLDCCCHVCRPKAQGFAHFEVGDEPGGHPSVVALTTADFQMAGEFLFGYQLANNI